jgi:glycosyltransferase involved in cell wall biosynthesis
MRTKMQNKVLLIACTYNNQALLYNFITSLERIDAGFDYDLVIADNSSTDKKHLDYLSKISNKHTVKTFENDRVEATFDEAHKAYINDYQYFMFLHDDTLVMQEDWLKFYIERLKSNYFEPAIKNTHYSHYKVARVAACHQPYRDYETCLGVALPSLFLKKALEVYGQDAIIYKYADIDRTLYTQECLQKCGIWSVKKFKEMGEDNVIFQKLVKSLNETLQYPDEGIAPKSKYPAGQTWNKFVLLSEFFNSVKPLMEGFRTVGLQTDGYLEQKDGFDEPWSCNMIAHLGCPHVKKFFAKHFKTTPEEIHKRLYENNLPFLLKCNSILKEYFQNA